MKKLAVVAFGGNALLRRGEQGSFAEQMENVMKTCRSLRGLLSEGYNLVIGHGNGPQVGNVLLRHDAGSKEYGLLAMPMDFCVAETQGSIGYMIEMGFGNVLREAGIDRRVVTLVTRVTVSRDDPGFRNLTKPVGPYYSREEAEEFTAKGIGRYKESSKGLGWRRVVASPVPLGVENIDLVKQLAEGGNIVITVGGGGIPVTDDDGLQVGVEAVIDKDLASALTAVEIGADEFYILTDVPKVYIDYNKPSQKALDVVTAEEAEKYLAEGQFGEGSMAPKVRAALYFIKHGGRECIITEAGELGNPACGTRIIA